MIPSIPQLTSPYDFDRNKPFFPLVVHYVLLLRGFRNLVVRALVGVEDGVAEYLRTADVTPFPDNIVDERDRLLKILGPLELRSERYDDKISISDEAIRTDIAQSVSYLGEYNLISASPMLILAHEHRPNKSTDPMWEFLRHCRNAAAHGGRFHFKRNEPVRPAHWGAISITRSLQGTPLFNEDCIHEGLLSPGDPIRLLYDLEKDIT